jgi:hypothetical protein
MTNFEFVFSLFGLLLGLSLAEVLGGFARAFKRHGRRRLGVLTPMLSVFLLYDITTFWIMAWRLRDAVPIHIATLIVGLLITGLYYFAAVLVWPEDAPSAPRDAQVSAGGSAPDWDDLDGWTMLHKRQVLLSVFGCNAMSLAAALALAPESFRLTPPEYVALALYFAAMVVGAFVRSRKATILVLAVLLGLYLLDLFANISGG